MPAFGQNGTATRLRESTLVMVPQTIAGFQMRNAISARLGQAATPRFQLEVLLNEERSPAAITEGGDTARFDLNGTADWVLSEMRNGAQIGSGQVRSFTSYSATGSTVATQTAEDAARERLVDALADLIVADLVLTVSA